MSVVPSLLAHQGGWDEVLLVLTPVVVLGALLRVAQGRAKRELEEERRRGGTEGPPPPP